MASSNNPRSSKLLIVLHSRAHVIKASTKVFVAKWKPGPEGVPVPDVYSRPLRDVDVKYALARKFG